MNQKMQQAVLASAAVMALAGSVQAVPYYWDSNSTAAGFGSTNGTWGTSTFWSTDSAGTSATANTAITASDDVHFGTASAGYTGGRTVTINATQTANSVTIGSASNAITFSGGTAFNLGNANTVFTQNSASDTTFSTVIGGGTNGLTKTGAGRLILTAKNTYTGNTVVTGGTLRFGNTWSNTWTGANASLNSSSNLEINNGIVEAYYSNTRALGSGAGEMQITGGRSGFSLLQGDAYSSIFWNFGNSATTVTWGSTSFSPTTLVLNDAGATSTLRMNNPFNLNGDARTVEVSATGGATYGTYATLEGALSGSGASLVKTGAGTLLLNGANTYNSGTTINQGSLWFNRTVAMPTTGNVSVSSGSILSVSVGNAGGWTTGTSGVGTIGGLLAGDGGQASSQVGYTGDVTLGLNVSGAQTYAGVIGNVGDSLGIHVGNKDSGSTDAFAYAGTLTLSNSNTFTGGTRVNRGTLTLGHATNTLADTGAVTVAGGTLNVANSDTVGAVTLVSGTISGSGVLTGSSYDLQSGTLSAALGGSAAVNKTTSGTVTVSGASISPAVNINAGQITFQSGNTASGLWTVQGGTLNVATTSASLAGGVTMTSGNLTVASAGTSISGGLLTLSGGTINVPNSGTGTTINNDQRWDGSFSTSLVSLSSQTITSEGGITLGANVTVSNKATMIMNGVISETGGSRKLSLQDNGGYSTVSLNAANTFSGGVALLEDQLNINHGGSDGMSSAIGTGTLTLSGGVIVDNTSGNAVTLSTNNLQAWNGDFTFGGTNSLDMGTGAVTINNNRTVTVNGSTFAVGAVGQDSGTRTLTKAGVGTLALNGNNSYKGATNINAGTLLINGDSTAANGAVTVAAAGTLGGSGIVGGTTALNGTLSPGNSPGTLTFASALNVNNGSTYVFEAGDLTDVDGALDLNDNWTLAVTGLGFQDGGSVTLFTYGSLALSPDLSPTITLTGLGFTPTGTLTLSDNGSAIVLNGISVVPEPTSLTLLGLGGLALLRRRRVA